jgi:phage repressor protein C with HTH and peptisase S24 domain
LSGPIARAPATDDDIPVYSSAQGGEHGMIVIFDEVERVRRPEPLLGVARAFAMYVVGDSMSPAYEHGDMVFIHPARAPGRGADVMLLKERDGQADALVKRLINWTKEKWKLQQFTPEKTFELSRKDWQTAYLIVGSTRARR